MMRSLRQWRLVLLLPMALLWVIASLSVQVNIFATALKFGFGSNNNNDERREQRRKLMDQQQQQAGSVYDDWADASTGTVRTMKTPEARAAEAAAQTCDGQMALSVVKAVEEKNQAVEAREKAVRKMTDALQAMESLETEVASTKAFLEAKLEATEATLKAKLADMLERLQAQQKTEDARITEITNEADQRVANFKAKADENMAQLHASMASLAAEKAVEITVIKTAAEKEVADANAKAGATVAQVQEAMASLTTEKAQEVSTITTMSKQQVADAQAMAEEAVAQVHAAMAELVTEKDEEINKMKQAMADHKAAVQAEAVAQIAAAEKERDDKVAQVLGTLEEIERVAAETLEETKRTLVSERTADVTRLQEEIKQLKKGYTKDMQIMNEKLINFEATKNAWQKEKVAIEKKFGKAAKDLEHWEGLFSQRSYCNLTHMREDAGVAAWVASMQATEKISTAAAEAAEAAKRVHQQALKSAEPHIQLVRQKSQRLYGDYAEPHIETLRPHYNQYAAPLLAKATRLAIDYHAKYWVPAVAASERQARQAVKDADTKRRKWYDSLVAKLGRQCPQGMAMTQQWAKENNLTLPKFLIQHWKEICLHPRESVSICLKALGLLAVYLLRRTIYRMILWCVVLPFVILWFLNPLRWLCATKKKKKKESTATTTNCSSQPPKLNAGNPSNGKGDQNTSDNSNIIRVKKKDFRISQ